MIFWMSLVGPDKILKYDGINVKSTLAESNNPRHAKQSDTPHWAYKKDEVDIGRLSFRQLEDEIKKLWG
jgi:hypothetical protein